VRGARYQSRSGRQSLALIELSPFLQERAGWPQDIGALVVLEGMEAAFRWDPDVRELLVRRLQRWTEAFPRAAQVVHGRLFGWRMPYWLAMSDLDLEKQIGALTVPAPGDDQTLLDTCAKLWLEPLDLTRPLWRLWLLDGLAEGRTAILIRLHHALADGAAALDSLIRLFEPKDVPADSRAVLQRQPTKSRPPRAAEPTHPVPGVRRVLTRLFSSMRQLSAMLSHRAPRTSLNRRVGRERRFTVLRYDLDLIKRLAHSRGVTINDVLLTAVAGGLHRLLAERGEITGEMILRAMVPIAGGAGPGSTQNATTAMVVRLPVGEVNPQRRLAMIAADTRRWKREPVDFSSAGFLRSRLLMTLGTRLAAFQRLANVYVANLRGPAGPLQLGQRRVCYVAPLVPVTGNLPLSVGALSCSGVFVITVVTDPAACGDVAAFLDGIRETVQGLSVLPDSRIAHASEDQDSNDLGNS
jgi:diacylglycerol O-acyltransferase / wax synthase